MRHYLLMAQMVTRKKRKAAKIGGRVDLRIPVDIWPWFRKHADSGDLSDNQIALKFLREAKAREEVAGAARG
jgi:hypothetical protein